jgi:hypothetical protein
MPSGLKRYYGKRDLHFITFSCYRRLPLLRTAHARDLFVQELGRVREEMGFRLVTKGVPAAIVSRLWRSGAGVSCDPALTLRLRSGQARWAKVWRTSGALCDLTVNRPIWERFIAQKSCDAKPSLTSQTPFGMKARDS